MLQIYFYSFYRGKVIEKIKINMMDQLISFAKNVLGFVVCFDL